MQPVEEVLLPPPENSDRLSMKTELIEQVLPTISVNSVESVVAPLPIDLPTTSNSIEMKTPQTTPSTKRPKRKSRLPLIHKKISRLSTKPATLLARPMTTTLLPQSAKPVFISNPMTPIIPKSIPTVQTAPAQPFTTYLVVDGNKGQFVQVANDNRQPVTFRNQTGQILQATPINVLSAGGTSNNPQTLSSFPINGDCSLLSNSSQTVTTVRTSSSIDMQQQTMLTSDTTTMTTQQLTGILHPPTILPSNSIITATIMNGNTLPTYEKNPQLEVTRPTDSNLSLSLSQLAEKANQRNRRSSSSSTSKKKRGRPRLYERDPFTNKPMKSNGTSETTEITVPNLNTSTMLVPSPVTTTTLNHIPSYTNNYNPVIFPNSTTSVPVMNGSLLQQTSYSYPSLLNNSNISSGNMHNGSGFNIYSNHSPVPTVSTTFPYTPPSTSNGMPLSRPSMSESSAVSPLKSLQIPSTSTPISNSSQNTSLMNTIPVQQNSPVKSMNKDALVHYIGGYVIRESHHPFSSKENSSNYHHEETAKTLQCLVCKKIDISTGFIDQERGICSSACSMTLSYERAPLISPSMSVREKTTESVNPPEILDEPVNLPADYGLPADPSKWTVCQVGEFIGRLTNASIREIFYESEMDGQALLLMTPEHLRETLKIKLGPSLIIASEIAKLRDRGQK